MAKPKISLVLNLGIYLTRNHQDTALVRPLEGLSTYVWTTYYQTAGFTSEAISLGAKVSDETGLETTNQDWDVRTRHDE